MEGIVAALSINDRLDDASAPHPCLVCFKDEGAVILLKTSLDIVLRVRDRAFSIFAASPLFVTMISSADAG